MSQNMHIESEYLERVSDARRLLKGYFFGALDLYTSGTISYSALCSLVNKDGIRIMFDIIEPLEHHKNKKYNYKPFYLLMLLCGSIYEFHKKTSISQKGGGR